MDEQELKALLRRADATAGPFRVRANLGPRVRQLAWRRQILRTTIGVAAAACFFIVVGATLLWSADSGSGAGSHQRIANGPPAGPPPAAPIIDAAYLEAEIARLEATADAHAALMERLDKRREQRERIASLERELTRRDPQARARLQLEKTACFLVLEADRLCARQTEAKDCTDAYRRVVTLFPNTQAAVKAQQRINELQSGKGGLS